MPPIATEPLPEAEQICSGQRSPQLPRGGETAGRRLLHNWLAGPIHDYEKVHDDLAADGTSRLSPYLHFGCVSPTEALRAAARKLDEAPFTRRQRTAMEQALSTRSRHTRDRAQIERVIVQRAVRWQHAGR